MLIWNKAYGLFMGQVFIFIILGQIEKHKARLRLSKTMYCCQAMLQEADALFKTILTPETLQSSNLIPLEWLDWQDTDESLMQFERISSVIDAPESFSNFH
jgi:hypothetical protein